LWAFTPLIFREKRKMMEKRKEEEESCKKEKMILKFMDVFSDSFEGCRVSLVRVKD